MTVGTASLAQRFLSAVCLCLATAATAATAQAAPLCRTVSQSEAVAIVVCTPKAKEADWRKAGAAACKGRAACNAWIWDDAAKAPQKAPAKDADMPKTQTGAAQAVLVTPGDELILIRKVK